jgi:hypothetical protein
MLNYFELLVIVYFLCYYSLRIIEIFRVRQTIVHIYIRWMRMRGSVGGIEGAVEPREGKCGRSRRSCGSARGEVLEE